MDEAMIRAAATGAAVYVYWLLIQKLKTHLRAKRDETGRGLAERIGYRLGRLWSGGNRRTQ